MNLAMIRIRGLSMRFTSGGAAVDVLADISLDVPPGQFLAVAGPSGSGKSTLLGLIAGLDQPTAGGITVAGVEITGLGEDALARFRRDAIGYVFQSFHLIPTLTALENVAVPLELGGEPDALGRRAAARGRGARRRAAPDASPRRRAHRQPRLGHRQADHRSPGRPQPQPRQH